MRARTVVAIVLACSTFASAQPGADLPPPEDEPPPPIAIEAPPPPPEPTPPVVAAPPGTTLPPINITITNNNTGNNNNANTQTNSQTTEQTNSQANPQTNSQTNSVPVTVTTSVNAPGAVAPVAAPPRDLVGRYEVFKPTTKPPRWITLGVSRSGVRGSIDLIGRHKFTLGVAATIGHDGDHGPDHDYDDERGVHHGRPNVGAVVYFAHTRKLGRRLEIRASLGLGFGTITGDDRRSDEVAARTTPEPIDDDGDRRHRRIAPRAEAALLVGLPLTKRLGLLAGPVISTTGRGQCGDGDDDQGKREVRKAVMAGLRFRF